LKPSVLQSEELFQVSQNRVRVTAFNLDSATVKSFVPSVSDSHYLLSTSTSDFEGIETFVYTFDKSSIVDLSPLPDTAFSQIEAYQYTSENESPSALHAASALELPDGTSLGANATFLEASIDSSSKPKIFSQTALNTSSSFDGSTPLLIHQYDTFVPFTYPGTVEGDSEVPGSQTDAASVSLQLTAPVQAEVKATVFEFLQSSNLLNQNDFNHNGAFGIWSPNEWASVRAEGSGGEGAYGTFVDSQDFRGYRLINVLSTGLLFGAGASGFKRIFYNGIQRLASNTASCALQVYSVNPGPPDPVGGKWVTDINLAPFASLSDGTTLYKKTIIVTDVIPAAVENDVPY
jgi:hypothetical protein